MKKYILIAISFFLAFSLNAQVTTVNQLRVKTLPNGAISDTVIGFDATGKLVSLQKKLPDSLSQLVDDIGATDPIIGNTVFVHTTQGNDNTARLENRRRPFATEGAAFTAIPNDGSLWTIEILGEGTTTNVISKYVDKNVLYKSVSANTINFTNATFNPVPSASQTSGYPLKIDAPQSTVIFDKEGQSYGISLSTLPFYINVKEITINGNGRLMSTNAINSTFKAQIFNVNLGLYFVQFRYTALDFEVGTFNITRFEFNYDSGLSKQEASSFKVGTINLIGGGSKRIFNYNAVKNVEIGNVYGDGTLQLFSQIDSNLIVNVYLNNMNLGDNTFVQLFHKQHKKTFVSGTNLADNYNLKLGNGSIFDHPGAVNFRNFTGKVSSGQEITGTGVSVYLENSNIEVEDYFLRLRGAQGPHAIGSFEIVGFCSITTQDPVNHTMIELQDANYPLVIVNKGSLTTNFKSYGTDISENKVTVTSKEKSKEKVIRSKLDIANKILDPEFTYIIDGNIELTDSDKIIITYDPANPNSTINGYGLEASSITKTGTTPLFVSNDTLQAGGLQMQGLKVECIGCPVFDLQDATGNNALEFNVVNIENSASGGELNGYRQFLGTTIGYYGNADGITLSSNWNGFKISNTNVFGFGSSGTLFKAGTGLTFNNRFYAELNLDLPTGAKISDFTEANFNSPELFQITNSIIKLNGTIDSANTSALIPNIGPYSDFSRWVNNIGITNSAFEFQDLKSPDGSVFRITVDDLGNLSTTEQ